MKRLVAIAALAATLSLAPASAALAFHHVFVPADDCGQSPYAGGNNPTATAAIRAHNPAQTLPLPPSGTPSQAPTDCPAPQK